MRSYPRSWTTLFAKFGVKRKRGQTRFGNSFKHGRKLHFEQCEDRRMLATFMVLNTDDAMVNTPAAVGTLRQAIFDANIDQIPDIITFAPGVTGAIDLAFGEIVIAEDLDIQGPGRDNLTIDAALNSRIFNVDDFNDTINQQITISGLSFTGGDASGSGGAINTRENLTLTDVRFTGNTASNSGGAIYVAGSLFNTAPLNLQVTDAEFSGNESLGNYSLAV